MALGLLSLGIQAQDCAVLPWPYGKKAALAITFDDNCPGQFTHARPALDAKGYKATFFVITGSSQCGLRDWDTLRSVSTAGHEIGSHSINHADWLPANRDTAYIRNELEQSFREIKAEIPNLPSKLTIGWPFGRGGGSRAKEDTIRQLAAAYYTAARSASSANGWETYTAYQNPFYRNYYMQVGTYLMGPSITGALLGGKVRDCLNAGGLMTLLYHGVETGGFNNVPSTLFQEHLDTLANHQDLWVTTFRNVTGYHKTATSLSISPQLVVGSRAYLINGTVDTNDYAAKVWIKLYVADMVQAAGGWNNIVPAFMVNGAAQTQDVVFGQDSVYALVPAYSSIAFSIATKLEKRSWPAHLKLYPNPAHGYALLRSNYSGSTAWQLQSLHGQTVSSGESMASEQQIPLSGLPAGTYILRVTEGTTSYLTRLVVE